MVYNETGIRKVLPWKTLETESANALNVTSGAYFPNKSRIPIPVLRVGTGQFHQWRCIRRRSCSTACCVSAAQIEKTRIWRKEAPSTWEDVCIDAHTHSMFFSRQICGFKIFLSLWRFYSRAYLVSICSAFWERECRRWRFCSDHVYDTRWAFRFDMSVRTFVEMGPCDFPWCIPSSHPKFYTTPLFS